MNLKEKISLENFGDKQFKIKLVNPENNQGAVLSHYLHNLNSGISKNYNRFARCRCLDRCRRM